tara:strand:+ start:4060 stop:5121 length:1062 start_codon:yes stop_codon:yes gene_type:complete
MKNIFIITIIMLLFSFSLNAQETKTLRILSWENFFHPEVISSFETKHNVRIEIIPYYSELMRDTLFKNDVSKNIDVILSTQSGIVDYINNGFLFPIEFNDLDNYKYIDTSFTSNRIVRAHSVAISYGVLGIAYRKDKVISPPNNWSEFINPDPYLKGKVDLIADPDDAIDIFLMGAGNDLRFYNIEELFHAAQLLHYFKDFVNEFGYNTEFENDPLMTGEVWLAPVYGFQFNEMIKKNKNLGFIYPKNTKIWRDNVAINSDSRNKQIALKFLNHLMNPKNSALNFKHNLYKPLNNEAFKYIPDDLKSNQYIYPDSNNLKLITDEIEDRYIRNKKHYFYYRISGLNGERNEITD